MQIARLLLFLGIWVAVLPYLGFPVFIKNILFLLTGAFFVYLSLLLYKEHNNKKRKHGKRIFDSFSENFNFNIKDGEI